jgi:hypothetical protein
MIDLEQGIGFKIEGELGKYQTLPISKLIDIAKSLQALIFSLAKYELSGDDAIVMSTFEIELSGFQKGSAIPIFQFTPRIQTTVSDYKLQRKEVNKSLDTILELSNTGNYGKIKQMYPDAIRRNAMVESIAAFTNSFGTAPVNVCSFNAGELVPLNFKINRLKPSVKKHLLVNITDEDKVRNEEDAFAHIKIYNRGKKSRKVIQDIIATESHSFSYSPEIINVNDKQYILNFPLRCLFEKEEDYFVIKNELLDLIGTGETQDDAELNFNEEFDFLYQRLLSLNESEISQRLINVLTVFNFYIKEIL